MAGTKSVFVSYSSQDRKLVNSIVQMMKDAGISYWKAPEMIPAGSSYAREIPKAIKECEVFLLVLSRTSQKSIWVEKETDSAISHRKTIIPFQIDDIPLNDTFRFYLNNVQMIFYEQDGEEAMKELKQQLLDLLGISSVAEERTSEPKDAPAKAPMTDRGNVVVVRGTPSRESSEIKVQSVNGDTQFPKRSTARRRADSNALRVNRIPLECDYCGCKLLENITMGTYRCVECGKDSYDDFQTIRNYLDKVGHAPAAVIERNTGVPKRVIEYFFRDEYLEIPIHSNVRVPCAKCGAPIRTGTLCDNCKKTGGPSNNNKSDARKGSWHSLY